MPHPALIRAGAQALAGLGLPSTLNGADAGRVHVARGVRLVLDDMEVTRDVATISLAAGPRTGMRLEHPDGTWTLDVLVADNGVNRRYVVV
jgi:hypothetical protein